MSTPAEKDRVPLIAFIILVAALGLFLWFQSRGQPYRQTDPCTLHTTAHPLYCFPPSR